MKKVILLTIIVILALVITGYDNNKVYNVVNLIWEEEHKITADEFKVFADELKIIVDENKIREERYKWYEKYATFTHSMGTIEGRTYTNSLEAFLFHYDKGSRVFEFDMIKTIDNELVLAHDWKTYNSNTLKNSELGYQAPNFDLFMNTKIIGKFTPLSFDDILDLMDKYDDVYFILDIKDRNFDDITVTLENISQKIENCNTDFFERIIPQAYSFELYNYILENYMFENLTLSIYFECGIDPYEVINFIKDNEVEVVVVGYWNKCMDMSYELISYRNEYNIDFDIWAVSTNDLFMFKRLKEEGFDGIGTDNINYTGGVLNYIK